MENENNSIVPVKPSDNAIVSISNQISLVNKLLANIKKNKKDLTHLTSTVTDIDGNFYHTVKIGTQWWMVENLKTSRFRDGSAITEIKDKTSWEDSWLSNSKSPACCYYDNNLENNDIYGKLYNWSAVTDPRGICPLGWHVPSDVEFQILIDYLGGDDIAGGKMKAQTHWQAPNGGADNSSGFSGMPGGARGFNGTFFNLGGYGEFWSSSEDSKGHAFCRSLNFFDSRVSRFNGEGLTSGISLRCLRD